ncbi:MAG: DMT family transporter [Alphaproteobacteria bacterium]|nr:DMT family transporter [Alphaproteobacteria bacterium]
MLAIGLRIVAIACVAIMLAAVKVAGQRGVHVMESLFYRQFLSLPLILGWLWLGPGFASVRTARIGAHTGRTMVGIIGMMLNFLSVTLLPLAEATTIGFTVPIFATILSALILKEATGIHRWTAVIIGFCGVLVMVHPDANHFPITGVTVGISAAITVAFISILLRQIGRTEATATTVFWFTILSLPPLAIGLILFGQSHDPLTWGLLALIGLSGGVGQLCLTGALRWAPVSVVLPMDYSSLLWATLLGWLIWDYWPGGSTWAGAILIVGSGLYIAWRERVRSTVA